MLWRNWVDLVLSFHIQRVLSNVVELIPIRLHLSHHISINHTMCFCRDTWLYSTGGNDVGVFYWEIMERYILYFIFSCVRVVRARDSQVSVTQRKEIVVNVSVFIYLAQQIHTKIFRRFANPVCKDILFVHQIDLKIRSEQPAFFTVTFIFAFILEFIWPMHFLYLYFLFLLLFLMVGQYTIIWAQFG